MQKPFLLLLCIYFFVPAHGQSGSLDTAFGNNGTLMTAFSKTNRLNEQGREVLTMADGSFFIVYEVYNASTFTTITFIAKYLPNGTTDSSYGNEGHSTYIGITGASAVLQQGKIIVAGNLNSDFAIARFNQDGSLDSTFSDDGLATADFDDNEDIAQSLTLQGAKILVAGSTSHAFSFNAAVALARYNSDGSLDSSFGEGGQVITDFSGSDDIALSVVSQQDKIIVAGYTVVFDSVGISRDDFILARYNLNGSMDSTFGMNGFVTTDFNDGKDIAQAVMLQGEKVVVVGNTSNFSTGNSKAALARYNLDGSLDSAFGMDGLVITDSSNSNQFNAYSIALQGGKIVVAGSGSTLDSNGFGLTGFALVRYNLDGSLDSTFGTNGLVITDAGNFEATQSLALQNDNILVAGTIFNQSDNDVAVARYNENGLLDSTFSDDGLLIGYFPYSETYFTSAAMQGDKILAVGFIRTDIFNISSLVARYHPDGSLDSTFGKEGLVTIETSNLSVIARSLAIQGDKIVVAGYTYPFSDFVLVRYNPDGSLDSAFGKNGFTIADFNGRDDVAQSVAIQKNKIIVVGSTYNSNTFNNDFAVARYNTDGSLDSSFGGDGLVTTDFANLEDLAESVVIQNEKIVVAGRTNNLFSLDTDFGLVRYNIDGSLDSAFGNSGLVTTDFNDGNDMAQAVALQGQKIVVAGHIIDNNNFSNYFAAARYNTDGSLDSTFNNDGFVTTNLGFEEASSVVIQGNKIIVGGTVTETSATTPIKTTKSFTLIRYNTDGSLDSTFSEDGVQTTVKPDNSYTLQEIVLHDNRLYAAGSIETSGVSTFGAIAAYQLESGVVLSCPDDKTVLTDQGACTAFVNGIDPIHTSADSNASFTYTLAGATTGSGTGSASGTTFNTGVTTVTYSLVSDTTQTCSFTVTVQDKEAPVITNAYAFPFVLWPPNHQMRMVRVNYHLRDNCGATASLSVTSSEPQSGTGPDDLSPDWQVVDDHHVLLRAESAGLSYSSFFNYFGRIYTIHITAIDAAGNKHTQKAQVLVPPDWFYDYYVNKNGYQKNQIQENSDLRVSVQPNPSYNTFTLRLQSSSDEPIQLRIVDEVGRIVELRQGIAPNSTIVVGQRYRPSVYFVEVVQKGRKATIKLVKKAQ